VLSDFLDKDFIQLNVEASDWKDAIIKATKPLVEKGKVTPDYVDDIVKGVTDFGPYIVITKHVALPHARPEKGALETAVGIVTLKNPVEFGSSDNDPVKYLFPLSAKDNDSHIDMLQALVELLSDPSFFKELDSCKAPEDVIGLIHKREGK
jgi:PTS system ascorbate-specific IIA component